MAERDAGVEFQAPQEGQNVEPGFDFGRPRSDEQWLVELSQSVLPRRLLACEPRLAWQLHHSFSAAYVSQYQSGNLLSAQLPFANGYVASVQFGLSAGVEADSMAYLGVGCLAGDRAGRSLMEVFDFSEGAVRAFSPSGDRPAREVACESSSVKTAVLALRQLEGLPDPLSETRRRLWRAIEQDQLEAAMAAWGALGAQERWALTPWGTDALEHALGAEAPRCSAWLLAILGGRGRGRWPEERLGPITRACLREALLADPGEGRCSPALEWALAAGAPITRKTIAEALGGAPVAQERSFFLLEAARARVERQLLGEASGSGSRASSSLAL